MLQIDSINRYPKPERFSILTIIKYAKNHVRIALFRLIIFPLLLPAIHIDLIASKPSYDSQSLRQFILDQGTIPRRLK